MYHAGVNVHVDWDYSHGAWNDVKCAARDVGAMGFLLSMLLVWNIPHGPWGSDQRSSQVKGYLDGLFKQPFNELSVLFEANAFYTPRA